MQKIELKHLAPYLPYRLKAVKGVTRIEITSFSLELPHVYHTSYLGSRLRVVSKIEDIKPILRPLSDLTKEEHSGIYNLLIVHIGKRKLNTLINDGYGLIDLPYFIFENLLELHFDVFGLISKCLAIDVNTLNK